jgi:1-acyl-sn-glycerol-3-phosphate acyltransferase
MGQALLSFWTWFEIALCALVGFLTQLVLAPFTLPFDRRRIIIGRCFRLAGVAAARLTPFWRFGVYGDVPRRIEGRTVFVSNHESQADPFLISFLPWEMKWLGKASLFRIPIAGWSMALAGDIPIQRGAGRSAKDAMDRCKQWLERGVPVIFFPEGTRSPDGKMGAFKDGAFKLALDSGAQIIPIAVCGTRKALPKHSWKFGFTRALVAVGTPIPTTGRNASDLEAIKAEARAQIEALRARMLPLTSAGGLRNKAEVERSALKVSTGV